MNKSEAFKVGFILRCVEEGLSPQQTEQRVKQAWAVVDDLINGASGIAKSVIDKMPVGPALAGLAAAPPLVGGLMAYGKNQMDDTTDADIAEAKQQELIDAYRRESDNLSRIQAAREFAKTRKIRRGIYL